MKGHTVFIHRKKKSPLELADLILQHNPDASMEMIANVISDWGGLFDDRRMGSGGGSKEDCAAAIVPESEGQTYCPHVPTKRISSRLH